MEKPKNKPCKHILCPDNGPCRRPIQKKNRTPLKRSQKRLNPYSRKRAKINRVYSALSKQYVLDNPYCAIKSPVCTGRTQAPHHKRGRIGSNLTDTEHMIPSCNACNGYVEVHDEWARENGFKESRLVQKQS